MRPICMATQDGRACRHQSLIPFSFATYAHTSPQDYKSYHQKRTHRDVPRQDISLFAKLFSISNEAVTHLTLPRAIHFDIQH